MLTLVSGVTCAGKTTYIAHQQARRSDALVLFPRSVRRSPHLLARAVAIPTFFHLCISDPQRPMDPPDQVIDRLLTRPTLRRVLEHPMLSEVVVISAPHAELVRRALNKDLIEPVDFGAPVPYPNAFHAAALEATDTDRLTAEWADRLERLGVPVRHLTSTHEPALAIA